MKNKITIHLASPRGFCAGVDRAIEIVKKSLEKFGAPVYVRHEIVHNKHVVESLRKKGAIFVEELSEIEDRSRPVIFSAHGVPKSVPKDANFKQIEYIDATCPLVSKIHREVEYFDKKNFFNFKHFFSTFGATKLTCFNCVQSFSQFIFSQFTETCYFLLLPSPKFVHTQHNSTTFFTIISFSCVLHRTPVA